MDDETKNLYSGLAMMFAMFSAGAVIFAIWFIAETLGMKVLLTGGVFAALSMIFGAIHLFTRELSYKHDEDLKNSYEDDGNDDLGMRDGYQL